MTRARALAVAAAVLAASCADDGPPAAPTEPSATTTTTSTTTTTTTTSTSSTTTSTASTTVAPTTTTLAPTAPRPPLSNADGANEALSGIAQLFGPSGTCTAFLVALGPLDGPATALTNGHCVGILDAMTVIVDQPVADMALRFRLYGDTPDAVVTVPVTAVAYGSMRTTDVAVLQLGATRGDVQGLASYSLGAPPASGGGIEVVGVPAAGIEPSEWLLRGGSCTAGATVRLVEWEWLWDAAITNDCAGLLGGSSGAPLFAGADRAVAVGILNTTTIGAPPGGACDLGRPCEITAGGIVEEADRGYAMPVGAWAACWAPSFDIANDGCPAEQPPVVIVDAPQRDVPPGTTWAATIANGGPDRPTVVKTGPVSTTDCRDPAGYGEPSTDTPRAYDAPLPDAADVYVLCAARTDADGAPSTAEAGYAVMQVIAG